MRNMDHPRKGNQVQPDHEGCDGARQLPITCPERASLAENCYRGYTAGSPSSAGHLIDMKDDEKGRDC